MRNFYNIAIMFIYPDGHIDEKYIDKEILHSYYYKELFNTSSRFRNIIEKRNIDINGFFYDTNIELVNEEGIIVICNIDIYRIKNIKNFLENNVPDFLFNLPKELTDEQKRILLNLFEEYYLNKAVYINPKVGEPDPVDYYELLNSLWEKRK